jgi:hypothetical protein
MPEPQVVGFLVQDADVQRRGGGGRVEACGRAAVEQPAQRAVDEQVQRGEHFGHQSEVAVDAAHARRVEQRLRGLVKYGTDVGNGGLAVGGRRGGDIDGPGDQVAFDRRRRAIHLQQEQTFQQRGLAGADGLAQRVASATGGLGREQLGEWPGVEGVDRVVAPADLDDVAAEPLDQRGIFAFHVGGDEQLPAHGDQTGA